MRQRQSKEGVNMDDSIIRVFNQDHIRMIPLDIPDRDFPNRVKGIGCAHCQKEYHHDSDLLIDHLQNKHGLTLKEIIPEIRI